MSDWVIKVEELGKRYRIDSNRKSQRYVTLRETLASGVKDLLQIRSASSTRDLWALKDVSFEVGRGEILGILGSNGAGKTTLLRILSRITAPTLGRVYLRGRLSSLLEVGTGFHAELTGRENIYLNGAILGMNRKEIDRKMDAILDFANLSDFASTPIKRFSSGMQVRLAISIAVHLEPEVMMLDEVLGIGDIAFQKQCVTRIKTAANSGCAVLLVSHHLQLLADVCSRAILLDAGKCRIDGPASEVIDCYKSIHGSRDVRDRLYAQPGNVNSAVTR